MSERQGRKGVEGIFSDFRSSSRRDRKRQDRPGVTIVNKNKGDVVVIEGDGHTINIGDKNSEKDSEEDRSGSSIKKDQAYRLLSEIRVLTRAIRDMTAQLRRLPTRSAWSRQLKHLVNRAEMAVSNHLSRVPILASSICRAIFEPAPPPWLQLVDLYGRPVNSGQVPVYPTSLIPSVFPHQGTSRSKPDKSR